MNKDFADLARVCREQVPITATAETRAALHEIAEKYDRMAVAQRTARDIGD